MATTSKSIATWKKVIAGILDFLTAFTLFGFAIASVFGGRTPDGFHLEGAPALLLFALVILYFVLCNRFLRGTLWKHIFGIARPKAA